MTLLDNQLAGAASGKLPVMPGTVLLGKYRVERVIGIGGMGVVAGAWHLDFDERVAIKFLLAALVDNEEAVGRFEREARVLFKIKSENVCRVIDVGKLDDGVPFMVMEYLDGHDLATWLRRREPLPLDRAIEYGLQACQALANAHVRGIVHRDLKPENLFIAREASGELVLKLLDFGLSKEHGGEKGERTRKLTAQEQVMGTPHYMSPEQWVASTAVSPASDQWALAAIVFEMLTGRPPFDGPQLGNVCSAIMSAPTPSVLASRPHLPPGLDGVLHKALEKHPHARYENVGAFAVALAAFAAAPAAAKAERTLKMLQRSAYDEEDASGGWQDLRSPRGPSDMATTLPKTPRYDPLDGVRESTSTSWQNMLRQQRSSRTAVGVAAATMIALTVVAIIAIMQSTQGSAAPENATPEPAAPLPLDEVDTEDTPTEPPAHSASPDVSGARPAAKSAEPIPSRDAPRGKTPPPRGRARPRPRTDIFDDR